MKTLLVLCVFLSVVLFVRAAAVEAVQAAPGDLIYDAQLEENEVAADLPQEEDTMAVDAEEVASAPEALSFLCPTGWVRYRSSCYLYVSSGRSWSSAASYCASLGASLASVHNIWDYSFLQQLTKNSGQTVAWMGGFYFQAWRWLDQSSFDYNNWSSQNTVSRYQCMHVNARAGWSNNNCATGWPSICMKRTDTC